MACVRSISAHAKLLKIYSLKRCYAVIPPNYLQPILKKETQIDLKGTDEYKRLIVSPIKPASTHETSSEFYDPLVRYVINLIMRDGKKEVARNQLEDAFLHIKKRQLNRYNRAPPNIKSAIEIDPIKILYRAIENSTPQLILRPIRKGGITYQVPVPVSDEKAQFIGVKWLIEHGKEKRRQKSFAESFAKELLDAANNQGRTIRKKLDLHKQCAANRTYAHYRWY